MGEPSVGLLDLGFQEGIFILELKRRSALCPALIVVTHPLEVSFPLLSMSTLSFGVPSPVIPIITAHPVGVSLVITGGSGTHDEISYQILERMYRPDAFGSISFRSPPMREVGSGIKGFLAEGRKISS